MLKSPLLMVQSLLLSLKSPRWPWLHFWATSLEPRQLGICCGPGLCDCCCAPVSTWAVEKVDFTRGKWFFPWCLPWFSMEKTVFHRQTYGLLRMNIEIYGWLWMIYVPKNWGSKQDMMVLYGLYGLFEVAVQLVIGVIIEIQMGIPIHQTVEIGTVERE